MRVERPHVLVTTARDRPDWPGLLIMWRQTPDGDWEGWVAISSKSNAHGGFDRLDFRWVPAAELRPT